MSEPKTRLERLIEVRDTLDLVINEASEVPVNMLPSLSAEYRKVLLEIEMLEAESDVEGEGESDGEGKVLTHDDFAARRAHRRAEAKAS